MKDTNRCHNTWWSFFILTAFFTQFFSASLAQKSSTDDRLSALLDSAEILKLKGFYPESIRECIKVRDKANELEDWGNYARSLVEQADVLRFRYYFSQDSAETDEALILMDEAKKTLVVKLDSGNMVWIRYHIYMGKLHKYTRFAKENSRDSLLIYLNMAKEFSDLYPAHTYEIAKVNYELGNYYFNKQMMDEAKPFMEKLLDIVLNNLPNLDYYRALYLENAGSYYADIGDAERSALCLENALYLYEAIQHDNYNTVKTRLNLGNTYFFSHNHERALNSYKQVIEDDERFNLNSYYRMLITHLNASTILYEKGDLDSCMYLARHAISLYKNQSFKDRLLLPNLQMNLARASYKKDRTEKVSKFFDKSISAITEVLGEKSFEKHAILLKIGEVYKDNSELDSALLYYQKGLIALYDGFNSMDIYTNPSFESYKNMEPVLYIIFDKAEVLFHRFRIDGNPHDLQTSLILYEKAYEIMLGLINDGFMDESMILLFQYFKPDLQIGVDCALEAYHKFSEVKYLEKAFQFIEQSRYFLLLKSRQSAILKERIGVADSLFLTERHISKDIEYLKYQLNQDEQLPPERQYNIRNQMLQKLLAKSQLWANIEAHAPVDYRQELLSLDEVQNEIIGEEDVVVEYYRSGTDFIVLLMARQFSEVFRIPVTPELLQNIGTYSQLISKGEEKYSKAHYVSFVKASNALFQTVFLPALDIVRKKTTQDPGLYNYTIVPDGELSFLPFEAFTTSLADTSLLSYWSLPYVCKNYVINYAFSLSVQKGNLEYHQQKRKSNNKIMAMSYSPANTGDHSKTNVNNELPYSAKEIISVGTYFKNARFTPIENASKQAFIAKAPDFSIIHLAIHGQADTIDRYNSKLIFRPEDGVDDDGALPDYELYNLDLSNTQLAVLSACETGIGEQVEGEGIFSMARAFAFAGCRSVVMSLWRANDKSTALLMDHFYKYLASGLNKDKALQMAKIDFINEMNDYDAHPSNWATFISLGNNEPVQISKSKASLYWLSAFLIIVAAMLILFRFYWYFNGNNKN